MVKNLTLYDVAKDALAFHQAHDSDGIGCLFTSHDASAEMVKALLEKIEWLRVDLANADHECAQTEASNDALEAELAQVIAERNELAAEANALAGY
jgi:hypothetical protein